MKKIKSSLIGLGIGVLAVLLFGLFFQLVSSDFRFISIWGLLVFFVSGLLVARWQAINYWFSLPFLMAPIFFFFFYFILPELPSLIFMPMVFAVSSTGGYFVIRNKLIKYVAPIMIIAGIVQFMIIPGFISKDLAKVSNEAAPEFKFSLTDGTVISKSDLLGKVTVIDFFGTWCRPCIAELPEIEKVYAEYKNDPAVRFYIIDSDQNGDTMEKLLKFISKRRLTLPFGYDHQSKFHQSLGFSGVPCLVVIDKGGVVRLKHEGFNKAEDVPKLLRRIIEQYLHHD
jgi:peroxiredoxin